MKFKWLAASVPQITQYVIFQGLFNCVTFYFLVISIILIFFKEVHRMLTIRLVGPIQVGRPTSWRPIYLVFTLYQISSVLVWEEQLHKVRESEIRIESWWRNESSSCAVCDGSEELTLSPSWRGHRSRGGRELVLPT